MSPEEHINSLLKFLLLPAEPGITDPPPIPLALDGLSPAVYLHAALLYIQQYAFDREFYKYTRKTRARYACTADPEQKEKARAYLEACITVDRSALAPLRTSYDAAHEQQEFIRKIIFPQRWALEELASEMLALVEFVRSEARTASAVKTPMDTGLARNTTVVDQVRLRDVKCRLTGVARLKTGNTAVQKSELAVKKLQVVHGLPFQMGDGSFALVKALTGINCDGWVSDSIDNAFLAQPSVQELFGAFQLHLEWTSNGEIMIRGRTGPGDPRPELRMVTNDRIKHCHEPGEFLDAPLRPRSNTMITDINQKNFLLHKFVGDIVWMCGGAEIGSDDEEDDEDDMVVSDSNIDTLLEKLRSPMMDLVPREQEMIFGSCMVLVPKDTVWGK